MVNHKPPSYVQSHLKRLNWARSHIMLIIWDLSHVMENPCWALLHPVSDFVTSVSCDAKRKIIQGMRPVGCKDRPTRINLNMCVSRKILFA